MARGKGRSPPGPCLGTGEPQAGSDRRRGSPTDLGSQSGNQDGASRLRGRGRPGRSGSRLESRASGGTPDRTRYVGAGGIRDETGGAAEANGSRGRPHGCAHQPRKPYASGVSSADRGGGKEVEHEAPNLGGADAQRARQRLRGRNA